MKRIALSVALAGAVFGAIVALAGPTRSEAGYKTQIMAEMCKLEPEGCAGLAKKIWERVDNVTTWSYLDECIGEGCNTEETEEFHELYESEANEENGSMEEIKEITYTDLERREMDWADQRRWVFVMLNDFKSRGWKVRSKDLRATGY